MHISRHITQKPLEIRQDSYTAFAQSDGVICTSDLIRASLEKYKYFYKNYNTPHYEKQSPILKSFFSHEQNVKSVDISTLFGHGKPDLSLQNIESNHLIWYNLIVEKPTKEAVAIYRQEILQDIFLLIKETPHSARFQGRHSRKGEPHESVPVLPHEDTP